MGAPSLADLAKYSVNRPGQAEVIKQGLYDTQIYIAAGQTVMTFFSSPQGQGLSAQPGNANGTKVLADTNMLLAGQLPSQQDFLVQTIEINMIPGSVNTANTFTLVNPIAFLAAASGATVFGASSDVAAFYNTGFLNFKVGSKDYLQEAPLGKFPPQAHLDVNAAVASTSATVGQTLVSFTRAEGRPYHIDPIRLQSTQNFNVTLNWPVAVAMPSGFNSQVRVTLDGYLYRSSQ